MRTRREGKKEQGVKAKIVKGEEKTQGQGKEWKEKEGKRREVNKYGKRKKLIFFFVIKISDLKSFLGRLSR